MQSKKWFSLHKLFHVLFFCNSTISVLVSHEALIILQQVARKTYSRAYQSIWNNHIKFARNCYNSTTLSTWFVNTCMYLKICLCLKAWFSTFFDITWYVEVAIYKKSSFLSSHSLLFWANRSQGRRQCNTEKMWHRLRDTLLMRNKATILPFEV